MESSHCATALPDTKAYRNRHCLPPSCGKGVAQAAILRTSCTSGEPTTPYSVGPPVSRRVARNCGSHLERLVADTVRPGQHRFGFTRLSGARPRGRSTGERKNYGSLLGLTGTARPRINQIFRDSPTWLKFRRQDYLRQLPRLDRGNTASGSPGLSGARLRGESTGDRKTYDSHLGPSGATPPRVHQVVWSSPTRLEPRRQEDLR